MKRNVDKSYDKKKRVKSTRDVCCTKKKSTRDVRIIFINWASGP